MGEIPLPGIKESAEVLELQRLLNESKAVAEFRAQSIKTLYQAGVNVKDQLNRTEQERDFYKSLYLRYATAPWYKRIVFALTSTMP